VTIESRLRDAVRSLWRLAVRECESREVASTREWLASIGDEPHVIWSAPASRRLELVGAAYAAEALRTAGVGVGAMVRTPTGAMTARHDIERLGDLELALRREPPGRPLDGSDPVDQQWWGDMLGRAHRELQSFTHPTIGRLSWPSRPELSEAVATVRRITVTDQLAYGVLHGQPHPELFRIDVETGRSSIARWGPPSVGPLLYDLAMAVCWAGGLDAAAELIDGYAAAAPVSRDELDSSLPPMVDLAAQARQYAQLGEAPDTG
jgi:Ser/Thr protein kinase RdoA (MazF antagonist)